MRISYLSLQISGLDEPLKYDPVIASIAWVENLMFLLAPNVMGINDKEDRSVRFLTCGVVLMDAANLFNHSCDPNVDETSDMNTNGTAITFRAARDISVGEELCISYIDVDGVTLEERQRSLGAQYSFACTCPRCLSESKSPISSANPAAHAPKSAVQAEVPHSLLMSHRKPNGM